MKEIYLRISKIDEGMSYLSVKFECLFDALLEQIELMKQGAEVQLDLEGTR